MIEKYLYMNILSVNLSVTRISCYIPLSSPPPEATRSTHSHTSLDSVGGAGGEGVWGRHTAKPRGSVYPTQPNPTQPNLTSPPIFKDWPTLLQYCIYILVKQVDIANFNILSGNLIVFLQNRKRLKVISWKVRFTSVLYFLPPLSLIFFFFLFWTFKRYTTWYDIELWLEIACF